MYIFYVRNLFLTKSKVILPVKEARGCISHKNYSSTTYFLLTRSQNCLKQTIKSFYHATVNLLTESFLKPYFLEASDLKFKSLEFQVTRVLAKNTQKA